MSGTGMEDTVTEDSHASTLPSNDVVHSEEKIPHHPNNEDVKSKLDANPEEIRTILEVIAATGKFWHDWDVLKYMLSFQLKQVLTEYPEAQMASNVGPHQCSLSGETYLELVKRLDEALLGFIEGPPFTLQRLCEILLNPKGTYHILSKLVLALEKNLLVTSTLTICTDPYPATTKPAESNEAHDHNEAASNGVGDVNSDGDEEMVDAESDEVPASKDTEMKEGRAEGGSAASPESKTSDPALSLGEPSATT